MQATDPKNKGDNSVQKQQFKRIVLQFSEPF